MSAALLAQNLEDAANITTEFFYSLDNLPTEIKHLLDEIKFKDQRAQELQQQIDSDQARYIRHSLRGTVLPPSDTKSTVHLPAKIAASYAEIHRLCDEKCALSERMVRLLDRTRKRCDIDLTKVRLLQGENLEPGLPMLPGLPAAMNGTRPYGTRNASAPLNPSASVGGFTTRESAAALGAVSSISDSLRASLGNGPATAPVVASGQSSASAVAAPPNKRRRITAAPSIKLPIKRRSISPAPAANAATKAPQTKSRLSRQILPVDDDMDDDGDADGDLDADGEEDAEDDKSYCICGQGSFGDMIACDGEGCQTEWFHISCVNLQPPLPDQWFCDICIANGGAHPAQSSSQEETQPAAATPAAQPGRKGRRKKDAS